MWECFEKTDVFKWSWIGKHILSDVLIFDSCQYFQQNMKTIKNYDIIWQEEDNMLEGNVCSDVWWWVLWDKIGWDIMNNKWCHTKCLLKAVLY